MDGIITSPKATRNPSGNDSEVRARIGIPTHTVQAPLSISAPHGHDPYINPYDTQPAFSPVPKMYIAPTSPPQSSPFADPPSEPPDKRRASLASIGTGSPAQSPIENGFAYGYAGPSWRGGAASQASNHRHGGDKWWHALCAWGSDLDGGGEEDQGDDQAGRTNPFE